MFLDFLRLLFPNNCEACGKNLVRSEKVICLHCQQQLNKTYYWQQADNPVEQKFWGLASVGRCCSFFYFRKDKYRKLLHKLKYKNMPQVGVTLGYWFGAELATAEAYADIDAIVPVPLHPKRQQKRGYNQSERIGYGMSQALHKPLIINALKRTVNNESQTKKNAAERMQNVKGIFAADTGIEALRGKRILVVDDVLTTGVTLDVFIQTILKNVDCTVSVATLAMATT